MNIYLDGFNSILYYFVFRIAIFSVNVLKDDRIVVVAEQRPLCTEEEVSKTKWSHGLLPYRYFQKKCTVEALISGHPRDTMKMSITGAGHL